MARKNEYERSQTRWGSVKHCRLKPSNMVTARASEKRRGREASKTRWNEAELGPPLTHPLVCFVLFLNLYFF